jgi:hypothetical protein
MLLAITCAAFGATLLIGGVAILRVAETSLDYAIAAGALSVALIDFAAAGLYLL